MIVAISYHQGDKPLMERWAAHVKKLGPYLKHEIILCPSHGASTDNILLPLQNCFKQVHLVPNSHSEKGWPVSCNRSFQTIAWHSMLVLKQPFLFMEPDAIPIKEGWIDAIEAEYIAKGMPFMGDFVELTKALGNERGVIDHMSGIAVYHWDLSRYAPRVFNCTSQDQHGKETEYAWDIFAASDIVHKMHTTSLIQHDWQGSGDKPHQWRKYNVEESFVRNDAVIYHPDKRGILMHDGLAGSESSVGGELRTGATVIASSFNHSDPALHEETTQVQLETTAQESTAFILERFNEALQRAGSDSLLKRGIKKHLLQHGWIKEKVKKPKATKGSKAKSAKQSGEKVRPSLGSDTRTVSNY